jgi:hypothetical protein
MECQMALPYVFCVGWAFGGWRILMIYRKCRKPDKLDGVGQHGMRPKAGSDVKAVRTGVGAALRTLYSDVLREKVSDRMAEFLKQLDRQKADGA